MTLKKNRAWKPPWQLPRQRTCPWGRPRCILSSETRLDHRSLRRPRTDGARSGIMYTRLGFFCVSPSHPWSTLRKNPATEFTATNRPQCAPASTRGPDRGGAEGVAVWRCPPSRPSVQGCILGTEYRRRTPPRARAFFEGGSSQGCGI